MRPKGKLRSWLKGKHFKDLNCSLELWRLEFLFTLNCSTATSFDEEEFGRMVQSGTFVKALETFFKGFLTDLSCSETIAGPGTSPW